MQPAGGTSEAPSLDPRPQLAIYAVRSPRTIAKQQTLRISDRVRRQLLREHGDVHSPVFGGKVSGAVRADNHRHLHVLPEGRRPSSGFSSGLLTASAPERSRCSGGSRASLLKAASRRCNCCLSRSGRWTMPMNRQGDSLSRNSPSRKERLNQAVRWA